MKKYLMIEHTKYGTYVWFSDKAWKGYKTVTREDLANECCIADGEEEVKVKIDLTKLEDSDGR